MIRLAFVFAAICSASVAPLAAQSVSLDEVEAALRDGANWHATELLQPALEAGSTKPEILIAGARAAAGWEGWPTVTRLIGNRDWLGTRFDAIGYRLLTDAALAEDRPSDALTYARLALPRTLILRVNDEAGRRWINLARAHERLGNWDSAGVAYTQAAALMPEVSDWLALRAAGVTADSATRARLYTTVTSPVARARIGWTEALAWTRANEKLRAAREYAAVGSKAVALRLRWEATPDAAIRAQIGTALVGLVRDTRSSNESRQAIAILDDYRVPLDRDDSFVVARRAADLGQNRTATEMLTALGRAGGLTAADRLALGDAQAARGNWSAAEQEYAKVTTGALAGRAAYQSARAKLRQGKSSAAITDLNRIVARFPKDTFAAGTALYLLADLALDAGRTDSARVLLDRLSHNYPGNEFAQRGALIAPLIAFAHGRYTAARNELLTSIERHRLTGFDADAGQYWIGRAHLALGDSDEARATFRALLERGPENYYAIRAAARLDTMPWTLPRPGAPDTATPPPGIARADMLARLGLDFEAGLERSGAIAAATTRDELVAIGQAFVQGPHPSLAPALATRIVRAGGTRDGDVWRLIYVLPYATALTTSAARAGVDPWLAAAVIRQESAFDPRARSGADARGLMQLLPGSGRDMARALGMRDFDAALLYQPDLNLAFGTRHLAQELARFPELERSLAAYNAGPGKAAQWSRTLLDGSNAGDGPLADPELFVERIPYLETRNYIRRITVNRNVYELLYGE
ncbi:MAG TPA: transglycosylase SLT domain-containing protein [Gemmatimonadales bacterium]|nr:transglycosylase SLT domain-containing protein [Gemmatimonadales bacterium]